MPLNGKDDNRDVIDDCKIRSILMVVKHGELHMLSLIMKHLEIDML